MSNAKTIWYCHHYAGSPSLGMSYRPYYLTRAFQNAGHQAYIISASEHHLLQKRTRQRPSIQLKIIDGVNFIQLKTKAYREGILGRLINMYSYVMRFHLHHRQLVALTGQPDVIIVSSAHPLHYLILEKLAKQYKARLVFEVRDLWPLSLIQLLSISRWNPFVMWLGWLERRAYRNADSVVSLLDGAFPYMEQRGLDKARFHVIPNGTSMALFQNKQPLSLATQQPLRTLKAKGFFLIGYAGAIGKPNALTDLIDAMACLSAHHPFIHCVMIGEGGYKKNLQAMVEAKRLTTITFLPAIPKYEIPAFLDFMDVLYLGRDDADVFQYGVSPNKLFDYMMAAKPIIESGGTNQSMVALHQCGIRCTPAAPNVIANAIRQMHALTQKERDEMGLRGRAVVESTYQYEVLARRYMELF